MDSEGARFKKARLELGLTLQDLDLMTGYSVSTISGVENGHDVPSKRLRALLIHRLDLNEGWLRTGQGQMFADSQESSVAKIWTAADKLYSPEEQLVTEDDDFVTVIQKLRVMKPAERKRRLKATLRILEDIVSIDRLSGQKMTVSELVQGNIDKSFVRLQQENARELLAKKTKKN